MEEKNFEAEREDQERQDYEDSQDREERELFRAIIQDERDHYERLKDDEPQDPDK